MLVTGLGDAPCRSRSVSKSTRGPNESCGSGSIQRLPTAWRCSSFALAVLVRWLVGHFAGVQVFTTFYPAIIIAALIGGLWPGILATAVSVVAAWYLVIPQFFTWTIGQRELVEFLLFIVISGVDVAIAVLLAWLVERLIIQQQNIRILLESAPNGFVLVDERGTIKLVNATAEKLFGYNREELLGKDVEALVPEPHVPEHRKVRASYQEKPELRPMGLGHNLSGRRKDGSEFPVEIGLNPVGYCTQLQRNTE